jgi:Prion-inhibition and propagation
MEIAALGISAASLVALFDTAIEGYKLLLSAAQDLPRDGRFLVTKFHVEEYRFARGSIWAFLKVRNASLCFNYQS